LSRSSSRIFSARTAGLCALLALPWLGVNAEARVFDFKSETFAVYFGGSFGNSNASAGAFALATPTDVAYDKKVATAATGEFGLLFSGTKFNLKIGAEYLMPRDQTGVNATDANNTPLFSLSSKISAIIPEVIIEMMPYRGNASRAILGAGYGYALVSLSNEYTMTSAGTSRFGVGDYKETGTGSAFMLEGYAGWEFFFVDTTTVVLQAGYRYCQVKSINSSQDTNAIPGAQKSGQEILNSDGSRRAMDLGGGFVGINFRFFL
jgi:hypothetical protein